MSALQVLHNGPGHGLIGLVATRRKYRRQGLATKLLRMAEKDFKVVEHSQDLTDDGLAWKTAMDRR